MIEEIISKLKCVRKCGDNYVALCPAHDDKKASLSITEIDGKLLAHCHAGCTFESIIAALGIKPSRYLPPPRKAKTSIPKREPVNSKRFGKLWACLAAQTTDEDLSDCAESLSVSPYALRLLGAAYAWPYEAWAFPMFDADEDFCGLRLRNSDGEKWAVSGSRQGIFIGLAGDPLWVCEGPTDCAALLTLGFAAIGRASAQGCHDEVKAFVRRHEIKQVVVLADNDKPGIEGAEKLRSCLEKSQLAILPAKDVREWVCNGATKQQIEGCIT